MIASPLGTIAGVFALLWAAVALAQDGPTHPFNDTMLDNMVGTWHAAGTVAGQSAEHRVEAHWILNHQFLQIQDTAITASANGDPQYEAMPLIGYDNASERYVAHWIDIFGGRFSETLGYGKRIGNEIEFVFEYPDGPFHTIFRWLPAKKQWQWLMRQKNAKGQWTDFADLTLARE